MEKTFINISLLVIYILYLIQAFSGINVSLLTGAFAALVILLHLPSLGKTFKRPTLVFAVLGAGILLVFAAPLNIWLNGFSKMLSSVAILISLQGLASAVYIGQYETVVNVFLKKRIKSPAVLYVILFVTTHILTGVMSLGSVVILLIMLTPLFREILDGYDEYLVNALAVGYSSLFIWSPSGVTVLMSTQIFEIDWVDYVGPSLILTVIEVIVMCVVGALKYRTYRFKTINDAQPEDVKHSVHVSDIVIVILSLSLLIIVLEKLGFSNSTGRVVISGTIVGLIWLFSLTGRQFFKTVPKDFAEKRLASNADLYSFFISMGLFSAAISYSGAEQLIGNALTHVAVIPEIAFIFVIPALIAGLSMIGVHPFVSVLIIGPAIFSMNLELSAIILAMTTSFGCALSYMISPFSGLILTMSNQMNIAPSKVTFGFNKVQAGIFYITGVLTLTIMSRII